MSGSNPCTALLSEQALTNLELEPGLAVRKLDGAGLQGAVRRLDVVAEVHRLVVVVEVRRQDVAEVVRTRVLAEDHTRIVRPCHHLLRQVTLRGVLPGQTVHPVRRLPFRPFRRRVNQTSPRSMPRGRKVLQKPADDKGNRI